MSPVHAGTKQWNKFINSNSRKQRIHNQFASNENETLMKVFAWFLVCYVRARVAFHSNNNFCKTYMLVVISVLARIMRSTYIIHCDFSISECNDKMIKKTKSNFWHIC